MGRFKIGLTYSGCDHVPKISPSCLLCALDYKDKRIAELEAALKKIRSETCLCRFDKSAGEGEAGTVPHVQCEYHKALAGGE